MIGYLEWAQIVLRAVLRERHASTALTMPELAADLGLPFVALDDAGRDEVILAIDHVLVDLVAHGVIRYSSEIFTIDYLPTARRYRVESLESMWPDIRARYLETEDETLLAQLALLSERPGTRYADAVRVRAEDVFAALGWEWDGPRALRMYRSLVDAELVVGSMFPGYSIAARVTYDGLVRASPLTVRAPQASPVRRSRGRPKGSRAVTRDHIVATFRELRTQYGRAPTQPELCRRLEPRIEVRTLRAALSAYRLSWPIE